MALEHRVIKLEQVIGATDGLTAGQRAILGWLCIWKLSPQKRSYLQQHAPAMIELAEPLQDILEDPAAFLTELAAQGITTLEAFLNDLHRQAHQ